jgi:hypothetical protein
VNAELQPSQKVLIDGIQTRLNEFDRILSKFDDLMLKTYLKYEHQPRFYHWIPIDSLHRKEFDSRFIVGNYEKHRGLSKRNDHAGLNSLSQRIKVLLRDK